MANLSPFCSCTNFACPIHPTKHDLGCAPCIRKNQRLREVPNCFFNLVEGAEGRTGDSFEDFAALLSGSRRSCTEQRDADGPSPEGDARR